MDQQAAVTQTMTEYYGAFSTLDIAAILPYFHEPAMLISPQGVFPAPTRADLATVFEPAIVGLRARGFGRTELRIQELTPLSATTVAVRGFAQRYKTDGQELDRAGLTYLMQHTETGWKIAVLVMHDILK
jgi:ketosteroid isomerase-like protein